MKNISIKNKIAAITDILKVNNYSVRFNPLWGMWQVGHTEIGARLAEFKTRSEAVSYCKNG